MGTPSHAQLNRSLFAPVIVLDCFVGLASFTVLSGRGEPVGSVNAVVAITGPEVDAMTTGSKDGLTPTDKRGYCFTWVSYLTLM